MKKTIILFTLLCMTVIGSQAQGLIEDRELASLVEAVKTLRNPSEANRKKVIQQLKADSNWTPMTETGRLQASECKPSNSTPSFTLNKVLIFAQKGQKRVCTKGDMLSGEDERYNYSLYERRLKKGKTATYSLKKRYGRQTLVLVPYTNRKGCLKVKINGQTPQTSEADDGTLVCNFNATGENLSVAVTNRSGTPLSFAILNHNSRKK